MKLRSQIMLAQLPTAIIIIFITAFFVFTLTAIEKDSESILVDNFKSILSMQRLNESVEELNSYIVSHQKIFDDKIKKLESKIEQDLLSQEKLNTGPGEENNLTRSLRKKWEVYKGNISSLSSDTALESSYKELKHISSNIIGLNQDDILRKKNELSNFIIDYRLFISTSSLISLIFGFFMSWICIGLFLSPLNNLIETVSQFGKTDETTLLHIKGSEEIEKLSEEFNLMTNRLEEYHQSALGHVHENYENLKAAFDALPDPLLLFDQNNEIIFMNRSASRLFDISGSIKKKNSLLFFDNTVRDALLTIVKQTLIANKEKISETEENQIIIFKKNKKLTFVPFAYPIRNHKYINNSKIHIVLILLQDLTRQSLSEKETGNLCRMFIQDLQAPLAEIQMAIFTTVQEKVAPLTEKQKEILFIAQDKCEEIEKLYKEFIKISETNKKNI